uniref:DnaJ (Hsp40) homolog, subfamily C, member 30b n=1 Tax=Sander lucioperca TaxID=283035 RepID=A0A8C9Y4G3_SANLU
MAEVGQRLGSGAYRLSALRNNQSRPVCTGESPGSLLGNCTFSNNRLKEKSSRDHQREVQPVWRSDSSSEDTPPLYRSRTSYYDILRVSPSATQSQVKTAYYKQSFIHHPDKNQGNKEAAQRFSDISEAYAVLGNISLRRKYDRGILSGSDIQSAGRPSSKETTSRFTGSPQHHQYRARRFSQAGGKTMFDFDAFYQAHYGEQLQREREMRARKQHMEEQQKENLRKWRQGKMLEMTVAMLLTMAGLLFVNLSRP